MRIALVLLLFAVSACAQDAAVSAAESACGPSNAEFRISQDRSQHPVPNPDEGKALVYVVLDQKYVHVRDVTSRVGLDGAWVGANRGNSHLFFSVGPGEHHLCTDWTSKLVSLANFTAETCKVYYFRARTTGYTSGTGTVTSIDLDLVNRDDGKLLVASTPLSNSEPKNQRASK